MRIVIFGANGQTGRLLTEQALAGGHAFGAAPTSYRSHRHQRDTRQRGHFFMKFALLSVRALRFRPS
jgi:hypothetical protein